MYDFDTADTWILRIAFATQGLSTPSDFKTIIYLFFFPQSFCWHTAVTAEAILTRNTREQTVYLPFEQPFLPNPNKFLQKTVC